MKPITAFIAAVGLLAGGAAAQPVPSHPDEIGYDGLEFQPPEASEYRTEVAGVPVYLAPSHELPLITVSFTFKGGDYMVPPEKTGLAGLTGTMMRTGGTTTMSPSEVDEELAFLAANVGIGLGDTFGTASLNCLSQNFEDAFAIFLDMVRNPGWDADRFDIAVKQAIEGMKQRNDNGVQVMVREAGVLLYGEDHFAGRSATGPSVESITTEDMTGFHDRVFHPGNLIVAVSGDFDPAEMKKALAAAFEGWERGEAAPAVPEPDVTLEPGIYYVEKDQEQGQAVFVKRVISRDDPDAIPVMVMNDLLGGSGFTSRITKRVRTDEGLAYTAGSALRTPVYYAGDFLAYYFSKVPTVAQAARTVLEEIERIREEPVSQDELETVKSNIIETFPRTFESRAGMLGVFVSDEWTGRDSSYWQTYRQKVEGVSIADVQRVAEAYLDPEEMALVIVGPWDAIAAGNTDTEDDPSRVTTMSDIFDGSFTRLPNRDPLTLKPLK